MSDIFLESVRALVLFGLLGYLVFVGRTRLPAASRGWNWILGGFGLLLFGSLIDITDNFDTLNRFVVIGDTETEAFREKFIGFLGGFVVLARGLVLWVPQELDKRKRAETALLEKTKLVNLLRRTALDANKSNNLADAMRDTLADICAYNGWPVGHAYIRSLENPEQLVSSGIWHLDDPTPFIAFREVTEKTTFTSGKGLPGRVMATGKPAWIVDVTKDENFQRAKLAEDIGVKAGFACPVLSGLDVVAVLEFFAPEAIEADDILLQTLVDVGTQLGRVFERERAEDELRNSQETMCALADNLPEFVSLKDSEGRFLFVNRRFEEWVGLEQHDVLGRTVHDIYPPEQAAAFDALDRKVMTDQSVLPREVDINYPDGNTRTVLSTRFPVLSSAGETIGLGTVNIDISELKRVEQELEAKEAQLRFALDNMQGGIFMVDKDLNLQVFSESFGEYYKFPKKLLRKGASLIPLIEFRAERGDYGPGDPAELVRNRVEGFHSVEGGRFEDTTPEGRIIERFRTTTEDGGVVTVFNDITERKQAQVVLRENEDRFRTFAESAADWFWEMDENLRFTYLSTRFTEISGIPVEDLLGKTRQETGLNMKDEGVRKNIEVLEAHRPFRNFVHTRTLANGELIYMRTAGTPIFDAAGTFKGYRGTGNDITEQKRAEEALRDSEERLKHQIAELTDKEERLEAQAADLVAIAEYQAIMRDELQKLNNQKDKFFSIIAHDLKGPFNSLLGYSSLLADKVDHFDKKGVVESATAVHESAQRVFKLLENLLEWSRLQMGQLEFEPGPVDLKQIIDTNLGLFAPTATEKAIRLTGKRKKPLNVFADAHMVDAIVRNLVNNAIKFTPAKGKVTISARQNGAWAEVEVSDTGVGISNDKVARLFRLDEKVSSLGTGGEAGSGLGLQLCKELVERQGGQINVESTVGKGSAFRFTLPLYQQ